MRTLYALGTPVVYGAVWLVLLRANVVGVHTYWPLSVAGAIPLGIFLGLTAR